MSMPWPGASRSPWTPASRWWDTGGAGVGTLIRYVDAGVVGRAKFIGWWSAVAQLVQPAMIRGQVENTETGPVLRDLAQG